MPVICRRGARSSRKSFVVPWWAAARGQRRGRRGRPIRAANTARGEVLGRRCRTRRETHPKVSNDCCHSNLAIFRIQKALFAPFNIPGNQFRKQIITLYNKANRIGGLKVQLPHVSVQLDPHRKINFNAIYNIAPYINTVDTILH